MSQNVSIMFLFIGALLTAILSWNEFHKPKRIGYKIILIIVFMSFLIVGTWDTCNRYSDSGNDKRDVINTIKKSDTITSDKIDTATNYITANTDKNSDKIIKSLPKISTVKPLRIVQPVNNQTIDSSGSGIQNNAPNFGQQAGRDINNFSTPPREVGSDIINKVKSEVSNFNTSISIARRSQDQESYEFATKIVIALRNIGYKNVFVDGITNDQIIGGDPVAAAKQQATIVYSWDGNQFSIVIPSNK